MELFILPAIPLPPDQFTNEWAGKYNSTTSQRKLERGKRRGRIYWQRKTHETRKQVRIDLGPGGGGLGGGEGGGGGGGCGVWVGGLGGVGA